MCFSFADCKSRLTGEWKMGIYPTLTKQYFDKAQMTVISQNN